MFTEVAIVFEYSIKGYKNGYSGSKLLWCATVSYPSTERLKYSDCTVNFSKHILRRIRRYHILLTIPGEKVSHFCGLLCNHKSFLANVCT